MPVLLVHWVPDLHTALEQEQCRQAVGCRHENERRMAWCCCWLLHTCMSLVASALSWHEVKRPGGGRFEPGSSAGAPASLTAQLHMHAPPLLAVQGLRCALSWRG